MKDGAYVTNVWKRHVGERNLIRSLLKNYSFTNLLRIFPRYLLISLAEITVFTLLGRFRVVWSAYIMSYWWNIARLGGTLALRRKIQRERRNTDAAVLRRMGKKSGKFELFKKIGIPRFASNQP